MLLQAHRILYIYDRVDLDVAKARESVSAGVKGLRSRGGQVRIKLQGARSHVGKPKGGKEQRQRAKARRQP